MPARYAETGTQIDADKDNSKGNGKDRDEIKAGKKNHNTVSVILAGSAPNEPVDTPHDAVSRQDPRSDSLRRASGTRACCGYFSIRLR